MVAGRWTLAGDAWHAACMAHVNTCAHVLFLEKLAGVLRTQLCLKSVRNGDMMDGCVRRTGHFRRVV